LFIIFLLLFLLKEIEKEVGIIKYIIDITDIININVIIIKFEFLNLHLYFLLINLISIHFISKQLFHHFIIINSYS
jgi:hypothetical protein